MDDDDPTGPRRRRRRRPGEAPVPGTEASPPVEQPRAQPPRADRKPRRPRPAADGTERGLRDIVGAGQSQVGVSGALRARDVNRPTDDDLAEAEATLVLVRRNWQPPDGRK